MLVAAFLLSSCRLGLAAFLGTFLIDSEPCLEPSQWGISQNWQTDREIPIIKNADPYWEPSLILPCRLQLNIRVGVWQRRRN